MVVGLFCHPSVCLHQSASKLVHSCARKEPIALVKEAYCTSKRGLGVRTHTCLPRRAPPARQARGARHRAPSFSRPSSRGVPSAGLLLPPSATKHTQAHQKPQIRWGERSLKIRWGGQRATTSFSRACAPLDTLKRSPAFARVRSAISAQRQQTQHVHAGSGV